MKNIKIITYLLTFVLFFAFLDFHVYSKNVRAKGRNVDYQTALYQALNNALMKEAGVTIDSLTIMDRNRRDYENYKIVVDKISLYTNGVISGYKITSEERIDGLWVVEVVASVNKKNIIDPSISPTSGSIQSYDYKKVQFRLNGGLTFAKYSFKQGFETYDDYYPALGFTGGLALQFNLSRSFSIEIGAQYVDKRQKFSEESDMKYTLDEINFPFIFKIGSNRAFAVYFLGGADYGIILSHKVRQGTYSNDLKDISRKNTIGVILGLGTKTATQGGNMNTELRFRFCTSNLLDENKIPPRDFAIMKDISMMVIVGFNF